MNLKTRFMKQSRWLRVSLGVALIALLLTKAFASSALLGWSVAAFMALVLVRYLFGPVCNHCDSTGCSHWQDEITGRLPPGTTGRVFLSRGCHSGGTYYPPGHYGSKSVSNFTPLMRSIPKSPRTRISA